MQWIATAARRPKGDVLIYAEQQYYIATLIGNRGGNGEPGVFMDVHSSNLLPWPSHWMDLPSPPGPN